MRIPVPLLFAGIGIIFIVTIGFLPGQLRRSLPCGAPTWYRTACPAPAAAPAPTPKICEPAWSCGHLARGEAGMKPGVWYLKYEDVSGPAKLEIRFADGATCSVDGVSADCSTLNPVAGSKSLFRGKKDGDGFVVSWIEFATR